MYQKRGFTLIELLVVVLIIGILSAAALPQYQTAVEKARLARMMPIVKSVKQDAEVYRMSNGAYPPDDSTALDAVNIPAGCTQVGSGAIRCKQGMLDLGVGAGNASKAVLGTTRPAVLGNITGYVIFFEGSSFAPNETECWAAQNNDTANRVCKSMGGVLNRSFAFNWFEGARSTLTVYNQYVKKPRAGLVRGFFVQAN